MDTVRGKLTAAFLGAFRLEWNGTVALETGGRIGKPQELLCLLLLERHSVLTNEQLIDTLWDEEETENPAGALKNTVYALRRQLAGRIPGAELILTEKHAYRWNPQIPVQLDAEEFLRLATALPTDGAAPAVRIQMGLEAAEQYGGELLGGLAERGWVARRAAYLRQKYLDTVCGTAELLLQTGERGDAETALNLCNRGILREPLCDALYLPLFTAMRRLEMRGAVMKYYPVVSNLFWDELGIHLPEKIQEIYRWAAGSSESPKEDIAFILAELNTSARDVRPLRGAYFCPYEVFVHMFHMVARSASRENNRVVLMLLTLRGVEEQDLTDRAVLRELMEQLKAVIRPTLRKGDVFSQYSRNQFVLMLPMKKPEDCEAVEGRLRKAFAAGRPAMNVTLTVITGVPEPLV